MHGYGVSGDIEFQRIHSDLRNATFTGGLYQNGDTDLNKFTVNGGHMIYRDKVELACSYALLTASKYIANWDSYRAGLNYFAHEYPIKRITDCVLVLNPIQKTEISRSNGKDVTLLSHRRIKIKRETRCKTGSYSFLPNQPSKLRVTGSPMRRITLPASSLVL